MIRSYKNSAAGALALAFAFTSCKGGESAGEQNRRAGGSNVPVAGDPTPAAPTTTAPASTDPTASVTPSTDPNAPAPASADPTASNPGGLPPAGPADQEFVQGTPSAVVTGINLTEVNVDNARIRCDFVTVDGNLHRVLCRAAVVTPSGAEVLATSIATGVEVGWPVPTLAAGKADIASCQVAANSLSQSCDVTLTDTTAKISLSVTVRETATGRAREEKALVLLPYSVGVAAGFVAAIPYLYLTGTEEPLTLVDSTPKPTGLQPVSVPVDRFQVFARSVCGNDKRLYLTDGSIIRVVERGLISHFAGAVREDALTDYSDRRRTSFQSHGRLACDADAVYVSRSNGDVLKVSTKGPVEVLLSGLEGSRDLVTSPAGDLYFLEDNKILRILKGKPPEVAIALEGADRVTWFDMNGAGDILYQTSLTVTTDGKKNYVRGIYIRTAAGETKKITADLACGNGCSFTRGATIGNSFFTAGRVGSSYNAYEVTADSTLRQINKEPLNGNSLGTDGKDLLVMTVDTVFRLAMDGSTSVFAGRDTTAYLSVEGPATEAQFSTGKIDLAADGHVLVYDEDSYTIRVMDAAGIMRTYGLKLDLNSPAPAFDADGNVLYIDGGNLYQLPATGDPKQLATLDATFPTHDDATEDPISFIIHGEDFYAVSTDIVTRRHAGGEANIVVGLRGDLDWRTLGTSEGLPAATHTNLDGEILNMAAGNDGSLYFIEDSGPQRLRKVSPDGILHTITTGSDTANNHMVSLALANDGTLYVADSTGTIDLFIPDPSAGPEAYKTESLIRNAPGARPDCGTGRVRKEAAAESVDGAIRASLSVMCIGEIRSIAIDDTCPTEAGRTRIMIGQQFSDYGNLIEIIRPCRKAGSVIAPQ